MTGTIEMTGTVGMTGIFEWKVGSMASRPLLDRAAEAAFPIWPLQGPAMEQESGFLFGHCAGANFRVRLVCTETGRPFMV